MPSSLLWGLDSFFFTTKAADGSVHAGLANADTIDDGPAVGGAEEEHQVPRLAARGWHARRHL